MTTTCLLCDGIVYGRGLCRKHYDADYYLRNRSKRREQNATYENVNKEERRAYARKLENDRYHNDPVFRFRKNLRRRMQLSFRKYGIVKSGKTFQMLGYSPQDLHDKLSSYIDKLCEYCDVNTITLTSSVIDHIVPICSATSKEEIVKLNQLDNLRLICRHCNAVKVADDLKQQKK